MKKSLLIIMTVAILGGLGLYINRGTNSNASLGIQPAASSVNGGTNAASTDTRSSVNYKDGTYTGSAANTPYGTVKIATVISGGKITDIQYLEMPNDQGHSQEVTAAAEPLLKQNAINAQSSHIDFVSGATSTSEGFEQSLQAALNQAAA